MPVVTFGSINFDLTAYVPRLPAAGETISGSSFLTVPGGKGANQAVCCARLGAPSILVGRTGQDTFGRQVLEAIRGEGVDTTRVFTDSATGTGLAVISVDAGAMNTIIIIAGANGRLGEEDVNRASELLDARSILLLQLETPLEPSLALARLARASGSKVILDPAPAIPLPDEIFTQVDLITPNEVETAILTGITPRTREDCARASDILLARGAGTVVLKLGERGVYYQNASASGFLPPFPVEAVDSVAAGDAFNGGLAVALFEGKSLEEAIRWGAAAGAIACTRRGAIPSMPHREELERLVGETR